jgi:cell division protein FtsW
MPMRFFGIFLATGATLIVLMVWIAPYRMARITSFMDPFSDPTDGGYQAIHGLYALATGGLWGVGLGNSAMKWDLLPHAQSDYIFAIIGEELGFLGCLVVVVLYGVLAYAGFRIARRSADRFVQLASVAITVWLIGQAAMNMGYVVGLLPVTGVQLPLISAGGTSLVLTLFIVGLLTRFARSEPAAIEAQRARTRGPLAKLFLPIPESAVDPVRPRRRPEERPGRPAGSGGRTLVHAGGPRQVPAPKAARSAPPQAARPAEPRAVPPRAVPPRERTAPARNRRPGGAR